MKKRTTALLVLMLAMPAPVWAVSRSATFNVSCTIPAIVQVSSARGAESNLANNYSVVQSIEKRAGVTVKMMSITAI